MFLWNFSVILIAISKIFVEKQTKFTQNEKNN